ncbi:MAG: sigma-70 family RNA polymerase sigma factor [Planctomycetaceae bacterium]|nr:sigma-70 family RNA polymerase sigma factor [Planctomycetaceae bacterium]
MDINDSIVQRLRQGCPAAYETLVRQFEGPLYRFFLCVHGDHHLAQDQSAETFAQLVRAIPNMKGGGQQLRGFVFAVARNVQRRHWRRKTVDLVSLTDAPETCDDRATPLAEAVRREELLRAVETIRQLDEPARSVLVLRFVDGLSMDEISHALRMPIGTVKSHVHRGRNRLKEILAEEECGT